jgi:hypothetical protein
VLRNCTTDEQENDESVVLPHGSIVCADGVFSHLPSVSDGETKRRNRRKSRPLNQVVRALQLSRDQMVSLRQTCKSLRASLSLPAVLTGGIRINGTGQLAAGAQVWFSDVLLGQATAGMFSLTRGTCHGIAVVGAARLVVVNNQGRRWTCGPISERQPRGTVAGDGSEWNYKKQWNYVAYSLNPKARLVAYCERKNYSCK